MTPHEFRLATPCDDAELRELCALPVPGSWVDLSYRREPNYFASLSEPGDQVLCGRYRGSELVAVALRCPRTLWVHGQPKRCAYLGGLRIHPEYQGRSLLFAGTALLHKLHEQDPLDESLVTIVEGNALPRRLLVERPHRGWPRYHLTGKLYTLALRTRAGSLPRPSEQARRFVEEHGRTREYFPVHVTGSEPQHWFMHDGVAGCLRDFSATRQTVVARYRVGLGWLAPLLRLPRPGQLVRGAYLGYWASDGVRVKAFAEWLQQGLALAAHHGFEWLYLGLLGNDPYLPTALRFPHRLYRSELFRVRYEGTPEPLRRPVSVELAWL